MSSGDFIVSLRFGQTATWVDGFTGQQPTWESTLFAGYHAAGITRKPPDD